MPSLTLNEIVSYCKFKPSVFIETGTYLGDTINSVHSFFDKVYSIELSSLYANRAKRRFEKMSNISILEGDSINVLQQLSNISDKPIFFWLDGHWSGGDTARGSLDCPLLEEIKIINNKYNQSCIVAIDDVRLFNTNINENWLDVTRENILEIVKNRLVSCDYHPSELYPEDRMIIHLKAV
jgi:hypothetical protein